MMSAHLETAERGQAYCAPSGSDPLDIRREGASTPIRCTGGLHVGKECTAAPATIREVKEVQRRKDARSGRVYLSGQVGHRPAVSASASALAWSTLDKRVTPMFIFPQQAALE